MKYRLSKISLAVVAASALNMTASVNAAENAQAEEAVEVIQVTGIRSSLTNALAEKRDTTNLIEVIEAVDIGKLPDQNLAEVLENVTGIQITRTAGIGTGVQIRGSNDNRVEINGASTVGTGDGRSGMSFEDLSAGIIAGVEVIKAGEAKTTEGSVGGTVNLRTIRPLELSQTLGSIRVQGEDSSLTTDGVQPRLSGAYGDNWELDNGGKFGVVVSASITRQEATAFRPRVDRDGSLVENVNANVVRSGELEDQAADRPAAQDYDFLGIQFLNQEIENFEYETKNFAGTIEYAPNDDMKFFVDAIITDQEVRQDSSRVQASGINSVLNQSVPSSFETVNLGSLSGVNFGSIQAAQTGVIEPMLGVDDDDPNLRFNSDTEARLSKSKQFRLGGEWQATSDLFVSAELSHASSKTTKPKLNTQLNFINPNAPLDGLDSEGNITSNTSNDNSVPFAYDLTGELLSFGINEDSIYAPTTAQLTDPNNVVLDQVDFSDSSTENSDTSFRVDATYFFDDSVITSVDVGFRYNETEHEAVTVSDRIGGFSKMIDSPSGALFSDLLVLGQNNFGENDGRALAMTDFIIIDPDLAYNNPQSVIDTLHTAMDTHRANMEADGITFSNGVDYLNQEPSATAAFKVEEDTSALYAQANFEYEMLRGNFGVRYIETDISSIGNTEIDGVVSQVNNKGDYSYVLPRINIVADVHEDVVLRMAWGKDIRRPDFGNLNTSVSYGVNENQAVEIGNPELEPEEITSLDISAEWYFAEAAVVSIGYFKKERTNIFSSILDTAPTDANGNRYFDLACADGGIYNPAVIPNSLGDADTVGLCVDRESIVNDPATLTQTGIEMAFQYDLSSFEDDLGWASGFGIQANYTIQDFKGGSTVYTVADPRGIDILNASQGVYDDSLFVEYTLDQGLLDFSENAYNFTLYYEKFGLSARLRYTWREAFRTEDTAAGASLNSTLGFPVVTHDRGQLNASVSYDVNDQLNLGVEAVNLTRSDIIQSCVNEGALQCAQGITDRRVTFGATYTF
ncbi:TonB-dependent receptor [Pseudocolwellia sp. HL-MZ7]|uniref:TonB-dependent receptor n=1 Tax=Pseudocolwellia sp. HL-MZ7 TaxID=3400627 RepID=UPI003CF48646